MTRAFAPLAIVSLLVASTALAKAPAPDPVELNGPREGDQIEIGAGRFEILPGSYLGATKFDCTVTQGTTVWRSGDQPGPHCEVPKAEQAKFKPGTATISVRAFFQKKWLKPKTATVALTAPAACSGPKCGGAMAAAPSGGRAAAAGIKVGSNAGPASWDSRYESDGKSTKLLWCPGLWDMKSFDVAGGEAKFQVWLGAVGATGSPKKAPSEDEAAHVVVTAKIATDGTISGSATFSAATLEWGKAHPDAFPAGATGLAFKGRVQNDDVDTGWTYDIGRTLNGVVTAVGGGAGSCDFGATAADYRHILTPKGKAALAEANKPRPPGMSCIFDNQCESKNCARFTNREISRCL